MTCGHWEGPGPELSELWVPAGLAAGMAALLVHRGRAVLLAQWLSTGVSCPLSTHQPGTLSSVKRAMSQLQRWCYWHPASWEHKHLQCTGQSPPQTYLIQSAHWLRWRNSAPRREFRWARIIAACYTFSGHMSFLVNPGWVGIYWFIQTWSTEPLHPPLFFFPNCLF